MVYDCNTKGTTSPSYIYDDIVSNDGRVMSKEDYPIPTGKCKYDKSKVIKDFKLTSRKTLKAGKEDEMRDFVYTYAPLVAGINATPLQMYRSGIIDLNKQQCSPKGLYARQKELTGNA